jgi:hypothetical protein
MTTPMITAITTITTTTIVVMDCEEREGLFEFWIPPLTDVQ